MEEIKGDLKISENTVVHCPTEELANQVLAIGEVCGRTWSSGDKYSDKNLWERNKKESCYNLNTGATDNVDWYKEKGYNVISAEEFIALHKKEENIEQSTSGRKYDNGKLRYDLIPSECMEALARILTYGANKYEANNWQNLEDYYNRYYAANERHIQKWRQGEDYDQESGELHLAHAFTNVCFLLWKKLKENKENGKENN